MARYIATIPNTAAGQQAVAHLKEFGFQFGVVYQESLSESLRQRSTELKAPSELDRLPYGFHSVEITDGQEEIAIAKILRWHSYPTSTRQSRGYIEALEPDVKLELSGLGLPFSLGGYHKSYLSKLNIAASRGGGASCVNVAVVDTGSKGLSFPITNFYDLTTTAPAINPGTSAQVDTDGHGTAMATLVNAVAPGASISIVRITDSAPEYMHVLAGLAIAVCDCQAEIVNLSFGFSSFGGSCGACGSNGVSRSIALERMLAMMIDLKPVGHPGFRPPIFVAAVGNQKKTTGFIYPAAFDQTIAVGSVNDSDQRSTFSNYGTTHSAFLVAPGGDEAPGPTENVGSGSIASCFGTSVSTAYVSGVLALMRLDSKYYSLDRDQLIAELLKMCTLPSGASSNEYGHGILRYV